MNKIREMLHKQDPYEGFEPSTPQDIGLHLGGESPMFRELIERVRPLVIVEAGTWLGGSAIMMAKHVQQLGLDCEIVCVDSWQGPHMFWDHAAFEHGHGMLQLKHGWPHVYYSFLSNVVLHGVQDIITPLPNSTYVGAKALQQLGIKADMIYIDAGHSSNEVIADLREYYPLLRDGRSVIFGDDYYNEATGVAQAVQAFLVREKGRKISTYSFKEDAARFWICS